MSTLRANPLFSILMFLGLVSAFLLPSNFTESLAPGLHGRDALQLQASKFSGLRDGMAVIYSGDIVGTLKQVGVAGGQVQLVTDPGDPVFRYFPAYPPPP